MLYEIYRNNRKCPNTVSTSLRICESWSFSETIAWWCNNVILCIYGYEVFVLLISDPTQFSYLCFCFSFVLWSQQRYHSLHNGAFSMSSPLFILTVADDGSKQRYIKNENWSDKKNEFQERGIQKNKDIIIVKT